MAPKDEMVVELTLDYFPLLDKGLLRDRNEDRCGAFVPVDPPLLAERGRLFVVVDGMGGHAAGDVAAEIALQTVQQTYFDGEWTSPEAKLRAAFLNANEAILAAAREGGRYGMGAAGVAAAIIGDRAAVAHLGDCRGYLFRGTQVTRLTTDHSWVQERMAAGRLTVAEARVHPYRNVLTRAFGAENLADPDITVTRLMPGDTIVLCSDGLWGLAEDEELAERVATAGTAETTARALVDLALSRGGHDNISCIVVRVSGPDSDAPTVKLPLRAAEPS
jgi:serine/threonine protein phosphatase PrpC